MSFRSCCNASRFSAFNAVKYSRWVCGSSFVGLRRGAPERAGKRRRDVGSDYHLFGWFLRRHFVGRWWIGGWRVDQPTVLEDFLDLETVKGFELEQRLRDRFKFIPVPSQHVFRRLVGVVNQLANLVVDLFGSRFRIITGARDVAAEEHIILVLAVLDQAHLFAHPPFANHPAS